MTYLGLSFKSQRADSYLSFLLLFRSVRFRHVQHAITGMMRPGGGMMGGMGGMGGGGRRPGGGMGMGGGMALGAGAGLLGGMALGGVSLCTSHTLFAGLDRG